MVALEERLQWLGVQPGHLVAWVSQPVQGGAQCWQERLGHNGALQPAAGWGQIFQQLLEIYWRP